MKEKPQFKVIMCKRNNFLITCLVLVRVRFLLHSRYEMSQQEIRYTKYAQYQHVLISWGSLSAEKISGWMLDFFVSLNQQNSKEIQQKGISCRT